MKTSGIYRNLELEDIIYKRHVAFKKDVEKNAVLLGTRNSPKLIGDDLQPFIGSIVAFYRGLSAYAHQTEQPRSQLPIAQIANEWASERDRLHDEDIKRREHQNGIDEHKLDDYHPHMMTIRILGSIIVVMIYGIGEVMFNTKGFELIGENKLFAFTIAFGVSVLVCVLSHIAPHFHKNAKTNLRKRLIELGTLALATGLFIALAILRTNVLAIEGNNSSPLVFITLNLFVFIVSCLFSYIIDPTLNEIKEHLQYMEKYLRIIKRKKEIKEFEAQKVAVRNEAKDITLLGMGITAYVKDLDTWIETLYHESAEHFKTTNIILRTDGGVPDCFRYKSPDLFTNSNASH
ncbi:MAG TPA: hypothetical protein VK808_02395 [Bacteroidia bacterium]|jgi:hypothetical protein|nr:hypothetical protein [Bacteroidia bacterium]